MNISTARSTKPLENRFNQPPENELVLGQIVQTESSRIAASEFPAILCHDPALQPHLEKPWVRAWIGRELGLPPPRPKRHSRRAAAEETSFARHCLTIGTSGSGKSRMFELLFGQLLGRGQSLVALDPKLDTLRQIAAQAQAAGLPPERITLISPRAPGGAAGWNPFLAGLPATETANDFCALINGHSPSWGIRLGDILANVALVVASHCLSVFELMEALRNPDYLRALLARPPSGPRSAAYQEAADSLTYEFLAVSKSSRTESVLAVTNKIRETLRNDFIRDLLMARTNTLDLSQLWKRQGVVLVHIDRASLGEEGAKLLAGMMASSIFRTSLRVKGPVPVNLGLDEISTAERFVGDILEQIAVFSRSANLRLLAAAQNLSQMGGPLQEALLSANVQVSFRLSPGDARLVAASLAAGTEPSVRRVRVEALGARSKGGAAPRSIWRHQLRDALGRPLRLDPAAWKRLQTEELFYLPKAQSSKAQTPAGWADPLGAISRLAAQHGMPGLYVRAADTGELVEIRRYVAGLNPMWYWVDGPQPVVLILSFPALRLSVAERRGEADAARAWTRTLQGLPVQHAVLRVGGGDPIVMRVADVPETTTAHVGPYLTSALSANGQSAEEVEACAAKRRETVLRLSRGEGVPATGSRNTSAELPALDPRHPFPARTSGQARKETTDAGTKHKTTGGRNEQPLNNQKSDEQSSDKQQSEGAANGGPSPFSFGSGGFADDGSLD